MLPNFLCFRMAVRNFTYYCLYFDKDLDCWSGTLKCIFSSRIELEQCSMTNMIIDAINKTMQAK